VGVGGSDLRGPECKKMAGIAPVFGGAYYRGMKKLPLPSVALVAVVTRCSHHLSTPVDVVLALVAIAHALAFDWAAHGRLLGVFKPRSRKNKRR
jgi:hypothetical protein